LAVLVVAKIAAVTEAAAGLLRSAGVAGKAFNDALPLVADLLPHDGVLLVHGSLMTLLNSSSTEEVELMVCSSLLLSFRRCWSCCWSPVSCFCSVFASSSSSSHL
jgi:hypothetical protein